MNQVALKVVTASRDVYVSFEDESKPETGIIDPDKFHPDKLKYWEMLEQLDRQYTHAMGCPNDYFSMFEQLGMYNIDWSGHLGWNFFFTCDEKDYNRLSNTVPKLFKLMVGVGDDPAAMLRKVVITYTKLSSLSAALDQCEQEVHGGEAWDVTLFKSYEGEAYACQAVRCQEGHCENCPIGSAFSSEMSACPEKSEHYMTFEKARKFALSFTDKGESK